MKIKSIERSKDFVPKFNGNLDLPEEQQVRVHIKSFPPASTANKYRSVKIDGGAVSIEYPADYSLLISYVGKIENLEVPDGAPRIFDGATLAKSEMLVLNDLIAEIRNYLITSATETLDPGEN